MPRTVEDPQSARARLTGPGMYPAEYAKYLIHPLRHVIFPVGSLLRRLQLQRSHRVLEIGCGPGYFSPGVARAIPEGRLSLFDAQPTMLEMAAARLSARGLTNYDCHEGDAATLPFDDGQFDVAFMVSVLGEVTNRDRARRCARSGRAGGSSSPKRRATPISCVAAR